MFIVLGRRIVFLALSPASLTFWKIKVNQEWVHLKGKLLSVYLLLYHKRTTRPWKARNRNVTAAEIGSPTAALLGLSSGYSRVGRSRRRGRLPLVGLEVELLARFACSVADLGRRNKTTSGIPHKFVRRSEEDGNLKSDGYSF